MKSIKEKNQIERKPLSKRRTMKKLFAVFFITTLISYNSYSQTQTESCNHANYEDYIWNRAKTNDLIEETGSGCQLRNIDLKRHDLMGAYFCQADLRGANLAGADLTFASLQRADLREGANLSGATIINTSFAMAIFDDSTLWPFDSYTEAQIRSMSASCPSN